MNSTRATMYKAFIEIVRSGDHERCEMVLNEESINPSVNENEALQIACLQGFTGIVQLLIQYPIVFNNRIDFVFLTCTSNHPDILQLLLEDIRFLQNSDLLKSFLYTNKINSIKLMELLIPFVCDIVTFNMIIVMENNESKQYAMEHFYFG